MLKEVKVEPSERVKQLEWEVEQLIAVKNPNGASGTELLDLFKPTKPEEIEWRIQDCGRTDKSGIWARIIPYIDARAVMDRLDTIMGPDRWKDEYIAVAGGFICRLSIFTSNGWVSKEDGSDQTDIEPLKGAISGALKRAAVKWGIGRDLYSYEPKFAEIVTRGTEGAKYGKTKDGEVFYWRAR